jgi:hypothetical protein
VSNARRKKHKGKPIVARGKKRGGRAVKMESFEEWKRRMFNKRRAKCGVASLTSQPSLVSTITEL